MQVWSLGWEDGNPLQYSCLDNPRGQRSLVGYSPWDHIESDMTTKHSAARTILFRTIVIGVMTIVIGERDQVQLWKQGQVGIMAKEQFERGQRIENYWEEILKVG